MPLVDIVKEPEKVGTSVIVALSSLPTLMFCYFYYAFLSICFAAVRLHISSLPAAYHEHTVINAPRVQSVLRFPGSVQPLDSVSTAPVWAGSDSVRSRTQPLHTFDMQSVVSYLHAMGSHACLASPAALMHNSASVCE